MSHGGPTTRTALEREKDNLWINLHGLYQEPIRSVGQVLFDNRWNQHTCTSLTLLPFGLWAPVYIHGYLATSHCTTIDIRVRDGYSSLCTLVSMVLSYWYLDW